MHTRKSSGEYRFAIGEEVVFDAANDRLLKVGEDSPCPVMLTPEAALILRLLISTPQTVVRRQWLDQNLHPSGMGGLR